MTKENRRLIFIIFLGIFLISAPLIVMYAWGFNFDFGEKVFIDTGGMYLKSLPAKAEIYLNDIPYGKTTGFIKNLQPKIYEVKIIKDEYHVWKKNLIVEFGLVARANNILLIPLNPKVFPVANVSEVYIDFFKESHPLTEIIETIKEKSKYKISKIENIQVDKNSKKIYFLDNNNLYYIDWNEINPKQSIPSGALVSDVLNYVIYKNGVMYSDGATGKIYELDLSSLRSAEFFDQVYPSFNNCRWLFSPDFKKLLCQKEKSLEVLYLDKASNGCEFKKGSLDKMDFEQKILDVIWHPKTNQHLIIATEDSILITELDNREPRNSVRFINTENPQIKYDEGNSVLYFSSGKLLYMTEI